MIDFHPYQMILTNSTCYQKSHKLKKVSGVLWHDTGCNNKFIRRYCQPLKTDKNYQEAIEKFGKNSYGNDWNHEYKQAGVNYFIGEDAHGNVCTVQALPDGYRPWGCGSGSKGSLNDTCLQFEICEDSKKDKEYARKTYEEAVRLTAYLCEKYNIDPHGYHTYNGVKVPNILCHWDAYLYKMGSGHDDIYDWYPSIIGKDMEDVRNDVAALLTKRGWVQTADGNWYYYFDDGTKATGWQKIDKVWYYFNDDGIMQTGWVVYNNKKYYMKKNGQMAIEWQKIGDEWYYFKVNGILLTDDWLHWKKKWYYFNSSGAMLTGWINYKNTYYWMSDDGHMTSNEWIYDAHPVTHIRGYWYISKSGKFTYTYKGSWHKNDKEKWWFKDESGWYAKDEIVRIRGVDYEFDSEGFAIEREISDEEMTKVGSKQQECFF